METFYRLPLVLEPQPEGGFTITCPLLPELITEADTMAEVGPNVADALAVVLEIYEDEGRALPVLLGPVSSANLFFTETLIPVAA
jgi:antitoxin HicB